MLIEELLNTPSPAGNAPQESDPLRYTDALQEAQLLDVRVEAVSSRVVLLLEMRMAMNFTQGNTAVLVARGVREFEWSAEAREADRRTAWNVIGSEPTINDELFGLELYLFPDARLRLAAKSAEFYLGDVEGLLDQLPDYGEDDDAAIRANLPGWRSTFSPIWATFADGTAA